MLQFESKNEYLHAPENRLLQNKTELKLDSKSAFTKMIKKEQTE